MCPRKWDRPTPFCGIIFWFFLCQSLVFSLSYLASLLGSYFLPRATRSFLVQFTIALYFLGWCCLIGRRDDEGEERLVGPYHIHVEVLVAPGDEQGEGRHEGRGPPVFIYGFFGCIVYMLHDVGFLGGTFAEGIRYAGIAPLAGIALAPYPSSPNSAGSKEPTRSRSSCLLWMPSLA